MLVNSTAAMFIAFCGAVASIGWSIAYVWGKRIDATRSDRENGTDVNERLSRIERAVDAVAVEVERLGEGQRFANRLLRDPKTGETGPDAPEKYRINTPH